MKWPVWLKEMLRTTADSLMDDAEMTAASGRPLHKHTRGRLMQRRQNLHTAADWIARVHRILIDCDSELSAYAHGRLLDKKAAQELSIRCRAAYEGTASEECIGCGHVLPHGEDGCITQIGSGNQPTNGHSVTTRRSEAR